MIRLCALLTAYIATEMTSPHPAFAHNHKQFVYSAVTCNANIKQSGFVCDGDVATDASSCA